MSVTPSWTNGLSKQEQLWLSFLRYSLVPPQFPREMLHTRLIVRNEREYMQVCRERWNSDCFAAIYTDWQRQNNMIDTIFLEKDYDDLIEANADHEKLTSFFKLSGIWARTNFSGRRSYHYYIDLPPTKLANPGEAIRRWIHKLPVKFDPNVVGDLARMGRIPGTLHSMTGLFCVPVNSPVNVQATISLENVFVQEVIPNLGLANELKGMKLPPRASGKIEVLEGGGGLAPPCIISTINFALNTGKCGHAWRIHLGAYLLRKFGNQVAFNFFKDTCEDFNPAVSKYNLEWLTKRNFKSYKCSRAKEMGICPLQPHEVCAFYPSLNWHL